ncbi:YccS family putative transporter [Modicisalibacter xianhensis]|uniref:TIGR01666 family membrane protein n=1 Tax=Modicisalibacter xianhensis TaxID=442341 RepID=A0A1I3FKT1_9GAMM|nr:YccS family putative transporter [Halomonas xianhensis]SFI11776.1 TIGR01666 family membrane protein [Halomonas xianhensis]
MLPRLLDQPLRRLWTLDTFAYSLRVFLALSGAMLANWHLGDVTLLIPLFLGIIASALAETDDNWQGRLKALVVTLACFSIASLSVELLFGNPWAFAVGLAVSAFGMTMLGAVGQRYGTIAYATLILAIYTMIAIERHGGVAFDDLWREPLLLVTGAAWYGTISVIWSALFSRQPLKLSMALLFRELGKYLQLKATLFEPVRGVDVEARRLALAEQNGKVVNALNQAKEMIFRRLEGQRSAHKLNRYLRLYFIAQDIHERASSSHYPYGKLAETFFHHDVLFRCQRLLEQQGHACRSLARALLMRQAFDHGQSEQALNDLHASLEYLRDQRRPEWQGLLHSLDALADNLATLEQQLSRAQNPDVRPEQEDNSLYDRSPQGLRDIRDRLQSHLTPSSPIFRHAVRLAVTLVIGYGVLLLVHPKQGYWILLTSLFVCRPNFGATRRFLWQRVLGTVIGLIAGWALITLFPSQLVQLLIAVAAGVVFFANRARHYVIATAAITLLVLCCFNQVGNGFGLIWPRLFDTLVGGLIAGLTVMLVLPDWQGRRLHRQGAATLEASGRYLREILSQYTDGKQDDLDYRLARRNAHNADAALSTLLANVRLEPGHFRKDAEVGFRFLGNAHTLLSYLSALGAHRGETRALADDAELRAMAEAIVVDIETIAERLRARSVMPPLEAAEGRATALEAMAADESSDERRLLQAQLALISRQLLPLRDTAARLAAQEVNISPVALLPQAQSSHAKPQT